MESLDTLDRAMNTIKNKGFINYYGKSLLSISLLDFFLTPVQACNGSAQRLSPPIQLALLF